MSISARQQTCLIYTPTIANDGGYASPSYSTTGTLYFCRVVERSSRERMATGKISGETLAVLELADDIAVGNDALFVVNSLTYRITGIVRRPLRRVNQFAVEWLDQPMNLTN